MALNQRVIDIFVKFRTNMRQFHNVMKLPMHDFKAVHNSAGRLIAPLAKNQKAMGRFAWRMRQSTHGMRGFKMEMLGVMFFGMGLARFFNGLLAPAGKMIGIFELLNMTIGLVFLPTMLELQNAFLPIMDALITLPEGVKLFIGALVIVGAVLSSILFLVGMFTLGLGALGVAYGSISAGILALVANFLGFISVLSIIGLVILAAIIIWKTGFFGFKDFIDNTFQSIKIILQSAWDDLKKGPMGVATAFIKVFLAAAVGIYNSMVWLVNAVKTLFVDILLGGIMAVIETIFALLANIPGAGGFLEPVVEAMGAARQGMYETSIPYATPEFVANTLGVNIKVETDTDLTIRNTAEPTGG